ncbi:hypothetical protein [Algihabitans albus]|uniref:hypothetical protein n=1 Tax=Algihabitans albus TaxID=2164067 RepID=UPI000E5C835D|nr:hypothetical protein [Algihabitans albus]
MFWRVLLIGLIFGSTALAQGGGPSRLVATLFADAAPVLPVAVDVYDDSELNVQLRDDFIAALQTQGVTVDPTAPLQLMLDLQVRQGEMERTGPTLGRAETNLGDAQVDVNVLSNTEDSVLGGRRSETGVRILREGLVTLSAQLRDPGQSEVVWQGDASTAMDARGLEGLAPLLVAPLAESYGRNVDSNLNLRP